MGRAFARGSVLRDAGHGARYKYWLDPAHRDSPEQGGVAVSSATVCLMMLCCAIQWVV